MDGCDVEEVEDRVCVHVRILRLGEGGVDHGIDSVVEGLGGVEEIHVLGRREVGIAADFGICAVCRALQPGRVFTASSAADSLDWDQLVSAKG